MEGTHRTRGKGKEKYGSLVRLEKITKQRSLQREYCNSIWIIMEGKREEKGREKGNKRKEKGEGEKGERRKEIRGKREEGKGEQRKEEGGKKERK